MDYRLHSHNRLIAYLPARDDLPNEEEPRRPAATGPVPEERELTDEEVELAKQELEYLQKFTPSEAELVKADGIIERVRRIMNGTDQQ